jgi:hypothetical protein
LTQPKDAAVGFELAGTVVPDRRAFHFPLSDDVDLSSQFAIWHAASLCRARRSNIVRSSPGGSLRARVRACSTAAISRS